MLCYRVRSRKCATIENCAYSGEKQGFSKPTSRLPSSTLSSLENRGVAHHSLHRHPFLPCSISFNLLKMRKTSSWMVNIPSICKFSLHCRIERTQLSGHIEVLAEPAKLSSNPSPGPLHMTPLLLQKFTPSASLGHLLAAPKAGLRALPCVFQKPQS